VGVFLINELRMGEVARVLAKSLPMVTENDKKGFLVQTPFF
jgi:hypothetical protein